MQPLNIIRFLFLGFLLSGQVSCSKKDQPAKDHSGTTSVPTIQSFSLFPGKDVTSIDQSKHWISVRVPDTVLSGTALTASFTITSGAVLSLNGKPQQSGITRNNFENDVYYSVSSTDLHSGQDWTVQAFNNDYSVSWGLGHFINGYASDDRSYDWYIDQSTSGNFAGVNCGPASTTMAIKWADSNFTKTALDARMTYEVRGGWWYTSDVDLYLTNNQVAHAVIALSDHADSTATIIKQQLMNQHIIILCLDMDLVRSAANISYHTDKFYTTTPGWGHFIVLKGYKITDGELFFEAYDPYSFGLKNGDNTLKGMNRYYRFEDLAAACLPWWNYAFVIAKKGSTLSPDAIHRKLNADYVPVAHSSTRIF
ncbi:MAG TPA: C39 family peptidase [Puia sp.]|nr:C39 family peptidase [Puia sp.]